MSTSFTDDQLALAAAAVAAAPDAIVIADVQGRIVLWNSGAERTFGHRASEAVGQTLDLIIPERLRSRHWDGYRQTMRTGHTRYSTDVLAVPATHRDGRRLSVEFRVCLLPSGAGQPEAIAAVIRDVTAHWEADRAMRSELDRLRRERAATSDPEAD